MQNDEKYFPSFKIKKSSLQFVKQRLFVLYC